jgi:hypothetical protein
MMTTSNLPDAAGIAEPLIAERLAALPPLPRDDDGPVFAEPWQAHARCQALRAGAFHLERVGRDARG